MDKIKMNNKMNKTFEEGFIKNFLCYTVLIIFWRCFDAKRETFQKRWRQNMTK